MHMEGRLYIGGAWMVADQSFPVLDPATGEQVGTAADTGAAEASAAVDAAAKAFPEWSALPALERARALRRLMAALLDDADRIADVIVAEQGKPRAQATWEIGYSTEWLEWFAEEARRTDGRVVPSSAPGKRLLVIRQPVGVALAITPWNFPVAMIA
jgi:succinate-semialdehyde dehydrogenase/glutarate-semialdehyde dehydrogenase